MTPKPYSEKSSLPIESSDDAVSGITNDIFPSTPSPETLSGATTPSPTPQEQVPVETFADTLVVQQGNATPELSSVTPCYPTPGDIMPYDHSLPDFIRQITNQPNLANLQSLSLRVISTLISLHRMAAYLPNLRELDLEGSVLNSLRDIGCNLKNLQILKVGRCQLESLDGTFGLTSLRELYAQKNFISDVSPCSNLPHIRHIDVSGNRIRNINYAGFLSVCSKLKSIVFAGNPASEASDYRKRVHRILPQVEALDGVPFTNEENVNKPTEEEGNKYCDTSDSGSSEISGFVSVSTKDSISYLFGSRNEGASENFLNHLGSDTVDWEMQKVANDIKPNFQLEDDLQNSVKKGFTEQGKNSDNRIINLKQKYTSIQKLDKDIENRSKKSNLSMNENVGEQSFSSREFIESPPPGSNDTSSTSASGLRKFCSMQDELKKSTNFSTEYNTNEIKSRLLRMSLSAHTKFKDMDEEQTVDRNRESNKLTTGLPVCGNLTAALRNRKKIQSARTTIPSFLSSSELDEDEKRESLAVDLEDEVDADHVIRSENDEAEKDVLLSRRKQSKRTHRARWEDEDEDEKGGKFDYLRYE